MLQALKLEPKNAKNALLFSNLGLVQRRLGEFDKALESYSFALNFAPLAVPILLDRAAIYMEMGKTDRAYTDYCQVLDEDKQNKEALLMRAYIYVLRRDYPAARIDYNRLLELDPQSYSGRLGLATLEQKEGKFREALEILNKMLAATPEDATLYIARADVEREMNMKIWHWLIWRKPSGWMLPRLMLICCVEISTWHRRRKGSQKLTLKKLFHWECLRLICTSNCGNASEVINKPTISFRFT